MPAPSQNMSCEVLISGAGPTGLFAALLLRRRGVSVRIVDRSPTAAKESRAFAIQARTLELLLFAGVAEAMLDEGVVVAGGEIYTDGKVAGSFDFDGAAQEDTPYPFILMVPQSRIEVVLARELSSLGVEVERGVEIVSLEQEADQVTTSGQGRDGPVIITSRFLLGTDGAHSAVRQALGLSFEGGPYAQTFLLADCKVEWSLDYERFKLLTHGNDLAMYLPIKGSDVSRVMASDPDPVADKTIATQGSSSATLEEVERAFVRATGVNVKLSDASWTTRYHVHHRGVDRYRVGRAFVAGDAAHIHSPAGGQGMNTGLQDAANLAWKLGAALRAGAPDALLDTYDSERRPIGEKVLKTTDSAFSMASGERKWGSVLRKIVMPIAGATLGHLRPIKRELFHLVSELGVRYHEGGFVAEEPSAAGSAFRQGPEAGRRVPNAQINRQLDVFSLIAGYGFTILAFSRTSLVSADLAVAHDGLDTLAQRFDGLGTHLVARSLVGRDPRVVDVQTGVIFEAFGLGDDTPQALYLVRPDGYVAWRAPSLAYDACARFLERTSLIATNAAATKANAFSQRQA